MTVVASLFFVSCGGGSSTGSDESRFNLTLEFPEGYEVNRTTGLVGGPGCASCNEAPPYITGVTLIVSNNSDPDREYEVSLETQAVSDIVPPGNYSFYIIVTTTMGVTFTGKTEATLVSGAVVEIVITLDVNAPPTDVVCTASNYKPKIGSTVTITCTASDPDGDPLTFTMRDGKGWQATGASNNYTVK